MSNTNLDLLLSIVVIEMKRIQNIVSKSLAELTQTIVYWNEDNIDNVLDAIYDTIDTEMTNGNFSDIDCWLDEMFKSILVLGIPTDIFLGILTATLPAKSKLPNRNSFTKVVKKYCDEELLQGLE